MAIELKKRGEKISLEKTSNNNLGEIVVNLNWNQKKSGSSSFLGKIFGGNKSIDLDLGCLVELTNGEKGVIQALGNAFGSFSSPPYIELDKDDRSGSSDIGENLKINGIKLAQIKRILVYTFIYEGVPNWAEVDGIVTIKRSGSQDIVIRMDEHRNDMVMCALAIIENVNNETFSIERVVQYFKGHQELDAAFGWGLRWVAGHK